MNTIFQQTINVVFKIQIRGSAYNIDSIEVIIFSLHFTLNICCDKGTQFFLIIPVIMLMLMLYSDNTISDFIFKSKFPDPTNQGQNEKKWIKK